MKVSEALTGAVEDFLEVLPDITSHIEKTDNPHSVTKEQVGLENVLNERQITENDLQDHADGTIYRHPAEAIDYSEDFNLKEKIEDLIITGGGGTLYHDELLNRDSAGAHPMSAISGLEGAISNIEGEITDVDGKIDEVIFYEGTTTGNTRTELHSTSDSGLLDGNGRIALPEGYAAEIEVRGVSAHIENGEITQRKGSCFIGFDGRALRINDFCFLDKDNADVYNTDTDNDPTNIELVANIDKIRVYVTGLADTTLSWQVRVRLKNVFDFSE